MRIAVCDDSMREREQVASALQAYDSTREVECFASGRELLDAASAMPPFDMVFLDIYMPGENGMEIAKSLRELSPSTGIVFVTTSMDYAIDAFSLDAVHYLVKPVTAEVVQEAVRRMEQMRSRKRPIIAFFINGTSYTIYRDEICYIQSVGHLKDIILVNGRTIRLRISMEEMEEKLGNTFLKLNRSIIVNMEQIEQMGVSACMLKNGTQLEFARRERAAIRMAYNNYLFSCLSERGQNR